MPTPKAPDVPAMMGHLSAAFIAKAREEYPQAPHGYGWMRSLANDLKRRGAAVHLNQTMISKIVGFSRPAADGVKVTGKIEIDTIVKVRNYVGISLEELLGIEPIDEKGALERRLAAVEALVLGHVESGTRQKK